MRSIPSATISIFLGLLVVSAAPAAIADDQFEVAVLGDGSLQVEHLNAYYNCCSFLQTDYLIDGDHILITEVESLLIPCLCLCYFDLSVSIQDLPAGHWFIDYTWDDDVYLSSTEWVTVTLEVDIPELGQAPAEVVLSSEQSECHDEQPIGTERLSFGQIKSLYR